MQKDKDMTVRAVICSLLLCVTVQLTTAQAASSPSHVQQNADSMSVSTPVREKRQSFDMLSFLQHYGYLPEPQSRSSSTFFHEGSITKAIEDFQAFTGLAVTGQLDPVTMAKMRSPRCGFPDKTGQASPSSGSDRPHNFFTLGTRWGKDTVTWKALKLSRKLSQSDQWRALERALKLWSDVTPLKFRPTTGQADIEVKFARGDHGDGYHNRFNGLGGVLAHAFQPGAGIGGDTHFDEDEDWSVGSGRGTDLHIVAAHEFGHALGLAHSSVHGSLMAPYYTYTPNMTLHRDDVQGIQALYGSKHVTPAPTTTTDFTTTTPATTTTTTAPTTITTKATKTTNAPTLPSYCGTNFKVDAVLGDLEPGVSYLFRHTKVYKVGPWGLAAGYPRFISEIFQGGPRRNVGAAVYLPASRQQYLFKGPRVWRFTDFHLDYGYPKIWLNYEDYYRFRPSAALTFTYGASMTKIFMFGDGLFWEWDPRTEEVVPGYPLSTAVYWVGAPRHPEAATSNTDNNFYFFKGSRYFKLHNRVSDGDSQPIGQHWFGLACGAVYSQRQPNLREHTESDVAAERGSMYDTTPSLETVGTSGISEHDIHRQRAATLPFEFELDVDNFDHRRQLW